MKLKNLKKNSKEQENEYRNMLTAASLIIEGALNRKESVGAHCRSDYSKNVERELAYAK